MDAANGAEPDDRGLGLPRELSLSTPRQGHEVHPVVPNDHRGRPRHHPPLPAHSPNLNAYAERWVKSVKEECLGKLILFGERSLRRALECYVVHYHAERNHQGKGNVLLFAQAIETRRENPVQCRERLGGLLRYYHRRLRASHRRREDGEAE